MNKIVIYSHGKDSIPWGEKTKVFADIALSQGYAFQSPDYRPDNNPENRVQQLLAMDLSAYDEIILVGSSMGAYVSTVAAPTIKACGLFLLAPAFYLPGYQQIDFKPPVKHTHVFHGWQDEVVPIENVWRFCQIHRVRLNMYDADHRLLSVLPLLAEEFERFLAEFSSPST